MKSLIRNKDKLLAFCVVFFAMMCYNMVNFGVEVIPVRRAEEWNDVYDENRNPVCHQLAKYEEGDGFDRQNYHSSNYISTNIGIGSDIYVMKNGDIVESGTHDELVANTNGKYYGIWHAQAQYYVE